MRATKELVEAVCGYQSGELDRFNIIYEESVRYLYTCIIKIVQNQEDAQDILQETYTEIVKSIAQLKEPESFLSWAGMIANRKCFAYLKKNQKNILVTEEDTLFEDLQDDENLIPENVMQDKEKQRLIREIIDNLSEMQKLCIIAYYFDEKKQEEIAEELGIPINSVKSHLFRAKGKIKEQTLLLEEEKGTRLYSITPLLLLLFTEDMADCEIPETMTEKILEAVLELISENPNKIDEYTGKKEPNQKQKKILITILLLGAGACILFALFTARAGHKESNMSDLSDTAVSESFSETETIPLETETQEEFSDTKLSKPEGSDWIEQTEIFRYDEYGRAAGGVMPVKKNGLWGAMDYNGQEIIPCEYNSVSASPNDNGCTVFSKIANSGMTEYFLIDANGTIIYQGTDKVAATGNLYMLQTNVTPESTCTLEYYTLDGSLLFRVETTTMTTSLNSFYNGVSTVYGFSENYTDYTDYSIGTLRENGTISWQKDPRSIEFQQKQTEQKSAEEQAKQEEIEQYGNQIGNGTQMNSFQLAMPANTVSHGVYLMESVYPTGTLYMYKESGEKIASISCDRLELSGNDMIYHDSSDYEFQAYNSYIGYFHDGDTMYHYGTQMVFSMDEKNVLVDFSRVSGTEFENIDSAIVQAVYDTIRMNDETYWLVQKGEQCGYIDHEGKEIAMYDWATAFYHGMAVIMENGNAYMINENFEKIKELGEADQIEQHGDFFIITKDGEHRLCKSE